MGRCECEISSVDGRQVEKYNTISRIIGQSLVGKSRRFTDTFLIRFYIYISYYFSSLTVWIIYTYATFSTIHLIRPRDVIAGCRPNLMSKALE